MSEKTYTIKLELVIRADSPKDAGRIVRNIVDRTNAGMTRTWDLYEISNLTEFGQV